MSSKINPSVVDGISTTNAVVTGIAPSEALSTVYQVAAHSLSVTMANATTTQQQMQVINTAVVARACANIIALSKKDEE